ncbi:MAG: GTPase ObgE [Firmicutes bacterium]|nr:GTPase ObgE [Bacillota bacterium]
MFIDTAKIYVKAGDGGPGCVSFRREKHVPRGGPDGGDGGAGGDVILLVDPGLATLMDFKYKRHYKAERGQRGMGSRMSGRDGDDLVIKIPPGTVIRDAGTGEVLADLVAAGDSAVVARGGRGGRGNARFVTSTRRAPRMAEEGEPGEERWFFLELKLLADVGLVGLPNAGKSTIISRISAARPKIADYPFTTLVPNLGVVALEDGRSFVVADMPGLISGAHKGAGLGHEFLRHVERTRVLAHVLDLSCPSGRDPVEDFNVVNNELVLHDPELLKRPMVVVGNKLDMPGAAEAFERVRGYCTGRGFEVYGVSALTGEGLRDFLYGVARLLEAGRQEPDEGKPVDATGNKIEEVMRGK